MTKTTPMATSDVGVSVPFIDAVRRQDWDAALSELKKDTVNIDVRDSLGRTALHYATALEYTQIVKHILHAGASPDLRDNEGMTPLHRAVEKQNTDLVRLLLDAGAMPNVANNLGETALSIAGKIGNSSIVEMLNN